MKRTVLYDAHVALGAKMVEFAGYQMPIQYRSLTDEHHAVRKHAGVFDVSHMGEIAVMGKEATELVDYVFTNNVRSLTANQVVYGMFCYEDGGVVDDLLVYKINNNHYLLVVNAANIDKDFAWLTEHNTFDCDVVNQSDATSEIALQGPLAESILQKTTDYDLSTLTFFTFDDIELYGDMFLVSRTGYTGEDGFEIYGEHDAIRRLFNTLLEDHEALTPCGLGARDTLRFEVALPLYGQELSADISPLEAGYGFAVDLNKDHFIGRKTLLKQKEEKVKRRIVGVEAKGKGILRHGYPMKVDDQVVGFVTSGYKSPSTGLTVALALIDKPYDKKGTEIDCIVRNRSIKTVVRNKKFYDKNYHK